MSHLISVSNDPQKSYYRTINLFSILDTSLSWKAKGIHVYMKTRPDNWVIRMEDLFVRAADGESAVRSGLAELIEAKYVYRLPLRQEGKIREWVFLVFTYPADLSKPELEKLLLGFPHLENLDVEDRAYSIKKNPSEKKKQDKDKSLPADSSPSSVPDEWLPLAQRLARIIQSRKNVRTTGRQLSSWAKEFARLGREAGVERDRMLDALAWYRQHAGEPYVPVIESGTAFREKFLKLEAAVERAKNPVNGTNRSGQNGSATLPQTQELQNEKALRSLGKLIEIHPSDLPRLDPHWQPLLASLGVGTSRFLELFAAWLDSSKQGFGGDWLRKAGQLKPGHLDPEGQTMKTFRRYIKWTTGEEEYS